MKIAWFTPFERTSAIGRFSQSVTASLSLNAEVDLWLAEDESAKLHSTDLRIIRYSHLRGLERLLLGYDAVIYNLGDHFRYHGSIYNVSRVFPGVVILHDYVMHHFFASYYDQRNEWEEYARVMARWYGVEFSRTDQGGIGSLWRVWERDDVIRYPLFEQAIQGSLGVITHSELLRDRVAEVRPGPVDKVHLAYTVDRDAAVFSRAELDIPQNRILAVTVGNVNENKRIDMVLRVLAAQRETTGGMMYVVAGNCDGPTSELLQALLRELNLQQTVRFTGYVDDKLLRSYLTNADFCINLRWPAMEGGSASCAEQMLFEKAIIVTDTGVYSELPDDCVRKVRPDHEAEDLSRHIRDLATNAPLRSDMGRRAGEYGAIHFSPEMYAKRVLNFCEGLAAYRPAFSLVELVGKELRRLKVTPEMAIVNTVARESALLLDGDYDPPILREKSLCGR
jgi:glycosyltransferase involved in cell wall biosynthesis